MKCEYISTFIYDYIDGHLSKEQATIIDNHAARCVNCANNLQETQDLKDELSGLFSSGLSDEFIERALDNTEKQYIDNSSDESMDISFSRIAFLSTAASLFIVFVGFFTLQNIPLASSINSNSSISNKVMATHQQHINMIFTVPKLMDNVQFTITLPDHVEMLGYPGDRQVVWIGKLNAGKNLLSIPVYSHQGLTGVLVTNLKYEKRSKTFKVRIEPEIHRHIS